MKLKAVHLTLLGDAYSIIALSPQFWEGIVRTHSRELRSLIQSNHVLTKYALVMVSLVHVLKQFGSAIKVGIFLS